MARQQDGSLAEDYLQYHHLGVYLREAARLLHGNATQQADALCTRSLGEYLRAVPRMQHLAGQEYTVVTGAMYVRQLLLSAARHISTSSDPDDGDQIRSTIATGPAPQVRRTIVGASVA
jgi:hypothetical protein